MKGTTQAPEANSKESGMLSNPLSFLRSGSFNWYYAGLVSRGVYGDYWSLRSYSTTDSNELYLGNTSLNPYANDHRGFGYAVRCESILLQILHHSH